ncbi:RNA polymerase sigma factor [Bacillus sp. APMAM]|nr:RNA polymerase sigma factor [Bacillus sp. APMAM]NEY99361.1 RNA polymerase sigma factor [Heyndrickxia shackletonii]RTZ53408.1 RNA polymerase sigma factor [Bacillus sp. SAJ1]
MTNFYEPARELHQKFDHVIGEFGEGLWNYCRYLTGSPWDGEDLYQETMLKVLGGLYQRWHPTNLKSYLYRIATNTWIDYCRREKRNVGSLLEEHELSEEFTDHLDAEEALEELFHLFTPRQTAVFLLREVFQFQADEVASMVKTTPGAVYATIRRMRTKLKNRSAVSRPEKKTEPNKNEVIQAYLKALNDGNIEGILALLSEHVHYEASLGFIEVTKDEIKNGSMQHGLPGHKAKEYILWGKAVIVVLADSEKGPVVHDIQYQEVENNQIVYHRSYFFRKEFIIAASKELGLNPQLIKEPFINWES